MAEALNAKVRVVSTSGTGEVADVAPEQLLKPDLDKITSITNQVVISLQNNLKISTEAHTPNHLALSEVEMMFGIDFGVEANTQVKVPIIGPVVGGGVNAGATFQVHIKLSCNNS